LPARSERLHGSQFRVTFYPPIEFVSKGDQKQDMYDLLLYINTMLSNWIKERPGQWLWVHRRWND
jgi:KDO2-lipid IV(A) lauroyltransferase